MTTRSHGTCMHVGRLALGELVRADDDVRRLERAEVALLDGRVVGLRFEDAAGQEELLGQLLMPLLAQVRGRDDEDAPLALRPFLREHEPGLDGLAEADLVGEQRALGEGRLEGEQRGVDLVRVQVDLRTGHSASELFGAVGRDSGGSARGRSTWRGSRSERPAPKPMSLETILPESSILTEANSVLDPHIQNLAKGKSHEKSCPLPIRHRTIRTVVKRNGAMLLGDFEHLLCLLRIEFDTQPWFVLRIKPSFAKIVALRQVWRLEIAFASHFHDGWSRRRCQAINQRRLRDRTGKMRDKADVVRFADQRPIS